MLWQVSAGLTLCPSLYNLHWRALGQAGLLLTSGYLLAATTSCWALKAGCAIHAHQATTTTQLSIPVGSATITVDPASQGHLTAVYHAQSCPFSLITHANSRPILTFNSINWQWGKLVQIFLYAGTLRCWEDRATERLVQRLVENFNFPDIYSWRCSSLWSGLASGRATVSLSMSMASNTCKSPNSTKHSYRPFA